MISAYSVLSCIVCQYILPMEYFDSIILASLLNLAKNYYNHGDNIVAKPEVLLLLP